MPLSELEINPWLEKKNEFEILIDARSPHEYAYSHIKNAQNLYALNDKEHHEIGCIYKENRSLAKVLGAKYISENLQNIIDKVYDSCKVGSVVGVYCAKGGMRSASIATVLSMIGYRVIRLNGGYKGFRAHVRQALESQVDTKFITLFGNTGCFKTKLIKVLSPSINLENIANHLGSVFGEINGAQPSQKAFEDELFFELNRLKGEVCFAEGESRKIGSLTLPATLHEALRSGVCVEVKAGLSRRIECIMQDYQNVDDKYFYACMSKISPFIETKAKQEAIEAFGRNDIAKVSEILLTKYYDKVYKKPAKIDISINSDNFDEALLKLNEIREEVLRGEFPRK
ncbi:tRNA 2-selenouridine(34) synthase MnmH [Campylobacter sp. RM13119]|uniref:tRNA 2-selenouridine(34) synthase MnmH n=1 Tax=Campylobacter TaxID=194 RepID=UPI001474F07E|nr:MULTISPECIES: tRNA 2-selenouridine(34) synthase MnmH [unclassified Campylobacter]MBE3605506.1 tRNA 2-selenouridine(34) synthase MnmH [Campylobacter sp. RM13119]MBE3609183.1 tRNA 2-selenouridine(34) synthase MnmH [Campylobacter sp. RM12916]